jgi:hypothetical protein
VIRYLTKKNRIRKLRAKIPVDIPKTEDSKLRKFLGSRIIIGVFYTIFALELVANFVVPHGCKNEVLIYLAILFITSAISIKALKFMYYKQNELLTNSARTEFLYPDQHMAIKKNNHRLRYSKRVGLVIFFVALGFPAYIIFFTDTYFTATIKICVGIGLVVALALALYAGYFFFIFIQLIRKTAGYKIRTYNRICPIATPIFNDFRAGISVGLMYFWAVGLLLFFMAFSHTYVLNSEPIGRALEDIIVAYYEEGVFFLKNFFGEANVPLEERLIPIWVVFVLVFTSGFTLFSFYPYFILRSKVLSLKVDAVYELYKKHNNKEINNKTLLEQVKFINDSPNWYQSAVLISAIPLLISVALALNEVLR